MLKLETRRGVQSCDGVTRRDFLRVGSVALGLSLSELAGLQQLGAASPNEKACIQLFLVGGPSQLDTWDPKPDAPREIRGPFASIPTNVPGVRISEHFPRMAARADRFAVLRSVYHSEAPIHETGHQLLQTGRVHRSGIEWPHFGAVADKLLGRKRDRPSWVVLPSMVKDTGVSVSHGQSSGLLGEGHQPFVFDALPHRLHGSDLVSAAPDPARLDNRYALLDSVDDADAESDVLVGTGIPDENRAGALNTLFGSRVKQAFDIEAESESTRCRYGQTTFGQSCLLARRLIERGVRLVTVNMFDTVFNRITWDCHANGSDLPTTLDDYRDILCPMFDIAYTALLDDLEALGLLGNTLVVSMGEFGRTPKINGNGGRDHWPGIWSILMAGGGVRGGQVVGRSTPNAEEPADRPIHAAEITATVYHALGIDLRSRLEGPDGRLHRLVDAEPIMELL
jgi:uncharacterized protein (DUF1501 family)